MRGVGRGDVQAGCEEARDECAHARRRQILLGVAVGAQVSAHCTGVGRETVGLTPNTGTNTGTNTAVGVEVRVLDLRVLDAGEPAHPPLLLGHRGKATLEQVDYAVVRERAVRLDTTLRTGVDRNEARDCGVLREHVEDRLGASDAAL